MNRGIFYTVFIFSIITLAIGNGKGMAFGENIDPNDDDSQYAYGENVGWLNFEPSGNTGDGAEVVNSKVAGYIWAENIGWINLSPDSYGGVTNNGAGKLSGYAWGENVGWINFSPALGGVSIDTEGYFDGWAWGENIGWIHLKNLSVPYMVQTAWKSTISTPNPFPSPTPTVVVTPPPPPPTPMPNGLVFLYTFDEGLGTIVNDTSGNGNDGTIIGATWTTGKSRGALSFDGRDDYVSVPRINNDEVSICAWFYKNANDTNGADAIFGAWRWDFYTQIREGFGLLFQRSTPDILSFVLATQDEKGRKMRKNAVADLGNSNGIWYHVVGTYNKTTGEQKLYVNGELVNTRRHPPGNTIVPLTYYPDMKIGLSGRSGYFYGTIDEVRLYNRALSGEEVQDLYSSYY